MQYEWRNGKWWPLHDWDECTRVYRLTHPPSPKPVLYTDSEHSEFYSGTVPPWDESLGEFRCDSFNCCCHIERLEPDSQAHMRSLLLSRG